MRYFTLGLLFFTVSAFSDSVCWQDSDHSQQASSVIEKVIPRVLTLNQSLFELTLLESVNDYAARGFEIFPDVTLPLPNGNNIKLKAKPTQVMSDELAKKFPDIKTYQLMATENDSKVSGRMDVSPQGVFVSLQAEGRNVFIEPDNSEGTDRYSSSWVKSEKSKGGINKDELKSDYRLLPDADENSLNSALMHRSSADQLLASSIVTYRLAISATHGYMKANGGTKSSAMRAIVSTINRVNQVYERDAGIRFILVDNNDLLIAPDDSPFSGNLDDMLGQNQQLVDQKIGSDNYDVGHLFASKGGGLAYVKSACRDGVKAMGASGNLRVGKVRYSLEFVAHEIGHQFGAMHTFNSTQGFCTSSNRYSSTAFEPGSGSTIMSYAGICGDDDLQHRADAMFHVGSIQQIVNHKNSYYDKGCGAAAHSSNHPPEVDAGADYIIPANTPFELKGTGSDIDQDSLVYSWQQQDSGQASKVHVDKGNNALFRSYLPTASKHRSFPKMSVLNGSEAARGEVLPSTNRRLHFKFVAYDTKGEAATDSMIVRVVTDEDRFGLDAIPLSSFVRAGDLKVKWTVANTNLSPISCSSVDIALSTDNGEHFDYILAKQVANSGVATVKLPDISFRDQSVRIKLSCSDNIFFSISQWSSEANLNVSSNSKPTKNQYSYIAEIEASQAITKSSEKSMGAGGSLSFFWLWMLALSFSLSGVNRYASRYGHPLRARASDCIFIKNNMY